jgi:hypothetical protein
VIELVLKVPNCIVCFRVVATDRWQRRMWVNDEFHCHSDAHSVGRQGAETLSRWAVCRLNNPQVAKISKRCLARFWFVQHRVAFDEVSREPNGRGVSVERDAGPFPVSGRHYSLSVSRDERAADVPVVEVTGSLVL